MIFMSTFPAGLNMYWLAIASMNLMAFKFFGTQTFNKLFNIPEYYPGTMKEREV